MRRMKGALLTEPGKALEIVDDLMIDAPRPGEALVRITHCGICQSDVSIIDGKMPYPLPAVLGHEAAGEIVALGAPDAAFSPGDRVVLSMRAPCDACYYCTHDQPVLCEKSAAPPGVGEARLWRNGQPVTRGFQLGAFAEYALVSLRGLAVIPDALPSDQAAITGCAVQTAYGSVRNVAHLHAGDTACVIGLGGIGLAEMRTLRAAGADVVAAVEPNASRREAALGFGADRALAPDDLALSDTLLALTGGRGFDLVLDNVATTGTSDLALRLTRPGGKLVLVGVTGAPHPPGFSTMDLVLRQKTVTGAFLGNCHPRRDLPRIMAMATSGDLDLGALITATLPFANINEGLARFRRGDGIRTVLCL